MPSSDHRTAGRDIFGPKGLHIIYPCIRAFQSPYRRNTLGPKDLNIRAQGNALGFESAPTTRALKGRNKTDQSQTYRSSYPI